MLKNKTAIIFIGVLALGFGCAIYAADQPRYRDPTQPLSLASTNQNLESSNPYSFKIDSIIISKNRKVVSINGQHLQVGDKLEDVTIVDIFPQSVRLKDNVGEFTINMPYYNIKSSVDNPKK